MSAPTYARAIRRRVKRNAYRALSAAKKRALMQDARNDGWRGSTYRSAQKFNQRLDREVRERARSASRPSAGGRQP